MCVCVSFVVCLCVFRFVLSSNLSGQIAEKFVSYLVKMPIAEFYAK